MAELGKADGAAGVGVEAVEEGAPRGEEGPEVAVEGGGQLACVSAGLGGFVWVGLVLFCLLCLTGLEGGKTAQEGVRRACVRTGTQQRQ